MKKLEDLKKLENKKYSPKEALAYYVFAFEKSEGDNDFKNKVKVLIKVLLENTNTKEVLENIDSNLLTEIKNYWQMTVDQLFSYGYIMFYNFSIRKQNVTLKDIQEEFVYLMKLYSPSNAEEFVENQIIKEESYKKSSV